MTTLEQVVEELDLHFKRINILVQEIKELLPIKEEDLDKIEIIKTIDSFIYRFSKVQDKMGDKLFPIVLANLQEYKRNMSLIDVLNKLEKLDLINSKDKWIDYRKLRNILIHEYPDNSAEIIESISLALIAIDEMQEIYKILKIKYYS